MAAMDADVARPISWITPILCAGGLRRIALVESTEVPNMATVAMSGRAAEPHAPHHEIISSAVSGKLRHDTFCSYKQAQVNAAWCQLKISRMLYSTIKLEFDCPQWA